MPRELARDANSYRAELDHPEDDVACVCGSCGSIWRYDQLSPLGDCMLTPGDPSPAGRCADPSCDSLAYVEVAAPQVVVVLDEGVVSEIRFHGLDRVETFVIDKDVQGAMPGDPVETITFAGETFRAYVGGPAPEALKSRFEATAELAIDQRDAIAPGEFEKARLAGYDVEPDGFGDGWIARDPDGDEIAATSVVLADDAAPVINYPTERAAWVACDNHRMFGDVRGAV